MAPTDAIPGLLNIVLEVCKAVLSVCPGDVLFRVMECAVLHCAGSSVLHHQVLSRPQEGVPAHPQGQQRLLPLFSPRHSPPQTAQWQGQVSLSLSLSLSLILSYLTLFIISAIAGILLKSELFNFFSTIFVVISSTY